MHTVGIIAEYNPFHTGHEYHIQAAKEKNGADYAIVVMSPDFVQRGEPAIFDKYTRTQMALLGGADLVIELPVCYASGSAEYFAEGAIAILESLGVIDTLCFGAESDDLSLFQSAAKILSEEPEEYQKTLRTLLTAGKTYPQARSEALSSYVQQNSAFKTFLASPNNILGVEYCRALIKQRSSIAPVPVKRLGSGYHSNSLEDTFCSATALRNQLTASSNIEETTSDIYDYLPKACRKLFLSASQTTLTSADFLPYLTEKLLAESSFASILDISSDLSERILNKRFQCIGKSYEEVISLLKTKQLTEARIRRALLHLLLDLHTETVEHFRTNGTVFYARILGFRRCASPLLHTLKLQSRLPLVVKPAASERILTETAKKMWNQDFYASHLYRSIQAQKYGTSFKTEYEYSPIIL